MFHCYCTSVQEDQYDNLTEMVVRMFMMSMMMIKIIGMMMIYKRDLYQPKPPLLFAHSSNPEFELLQCEHQAWYEQEYYLLITMIIFNIINDIINDIIVIIITTDLKPP